MAYLPQEDDDNQSSQGSLITGGGSAPRQAAAPKGSGSFTNIRQYIDANKPKSAKLVDPLVKPIEQGATQVRGRIGEEQAGLESTIKPEEQFYSGAPTLTSQAIQGAGLTDYSTDAGKKQLADFTKVRKAQSTEQDKIDLTKEKGQAKDVEKDAARTQNRAGRQVLLRETFGAPRYTSGQQRLDELLLSKTRENRKALTKRAKAGQGLTGQIDEAVQLGDQRLTDLDAQKLEQQTALLEQLRGTRDGIGTPYQGGALGDQTTAIQDEVTRAEQERTDITNVSNEVNELRNNSTQGEGQVSQLSDQIASKIGLVPGQTIRTYGVNINDFINQDNISLTGAATQEQIARYNGLKQLAGEDYAANILAQETGIEPNSWKDFNTEAFGQAIEQAKGIYETQRNEITTRYDQVKADSDFYANLASGDPGSEIELYARAEYNRYWHWVTKNVWGQSGGYPAFRHIMGNKYRENLYASHDILREVESFDGQNNVGISYGGQALEKIGDTPIETDPRQHYKYQEWLANDLAQARTTNHHGYGTLAGWQNRAEAGVGTAGDNAAASAAGAAAAGAAAAADAASPSGVGGNDGIGAAGESPGGQN